MKWTSLDCGGLVYPDLRRAPAFEVANVASNEPFQPRLSLSKTCCESPVARYPSKIACSACDPAPLAYSKAPIYFTQPTSPICARCAERISDPALREGNAQWNLLVLFRSTRGQTNSVSVEWSPSSDS